MLVVHFLPKSSLIHDYRMSTSTYYFHHFRRFFSYLVKAKERQNEFSYFQSLQKEGIQSSELNSRLKLVSSSLGRQLQVRQLLRNFSYFVKDKERHNYRQLLIIFLYFVKAEEKRNKFSYFQSLQKKGIQSSEIDFFVIKTSQKFAIAYGDQNRNLLFF